MMIFVLHASMEKTIMLMTFYSSHLFFRGQTKKVL